MSYQLKVDCNITREGKGGANILAFPRGGVEKAPFIRLGGGLSSLPQKTEGLQDVESSRKYFRRGGKGGGGDLDIAKPFSERVKLYRFPTRQP